MPLRPTALFYLGLFPVVLILWAWADSAYHVITVTRNSGAQQVTVASVRSLIFIRTRSAEPLATKRSSAPTYPPNGLFGKTTRKELQAGIMSLSNSLAREPGSCFPAYKQAAFVTDHHGFKESLSMTHLPFWFLLAAYLPFWLALSWWHARRKQKRLLASLPTSSPAQPQTDLDLRV